MLADEHCETIAGFILWESQKEKRICRSTATGEILSCVSGLDCGIWLRQLWWELSDEWIPIVLVTDSDGTAKNSITTRLPREKRNRIDIVRIQQCRPYSDDRYSP